MDDSFKGVVLAVCLFIGYNPFKEFRAPCPFDSFYWFYLNWLFFSTRRNKKDN